ncbi:MAG TPA: Rieske 2Fe-2S domain-containing protein [Candidatus Dormibacteraeota bacterium]|jgi:phenylpropionate dioxygenase-like ring-hydroxylating dioxygenase large terminal subunit|nr:Rieske 2Fe-2S domain-containing protein [Candidatus Dormibacteraeota bacterium]
MALVDVERALTQRRAYWDPEIHQQELERIFRKSWLFVAHESELAHNGDYVTRRMGSDPVIVVRDEHGKVRVFLNSCPHRGAALCRADMGNTSHFRCSYHGWTFANDGAARGIPEINEVYPKSFDKSAIHLFEVPHVEAYDGLIFANWDEDAPSLQDYLGNFSFYVHALFGKADFEVVGPPMRGIVKTNWKIGVDNYVGDGYHLSTTHKSAIDMGIFETGRESERIGRFSERTPSHCISADNGHGIRVQQMPIEFDTPTFLGWPQRYWDTFTSRLNPDQVEMLQALAVAHGNIFPNASILEALAPHVGSDTFPAAYLHLRQWHPISADTTELWMWCFVPKGMSADEKMGSQRAFLRHLGFGGCFETDDFQNWTSAASNNRSPLTWDFTFNHQGRSVEAGNDVPWPGNVFPVDHTEVNQQNLLRRWHDLMEVAPSNGNGNGHPANGH